MKLIIDITDEYYNILIDSKYDKFRNIEFEHLDLVLKIKNGTPLDEELKKIKEELNKEGWYNTCDKRQFAKIINKHIRKAGDGDE